MVDIDQYKKQLIQQAKAFAKEAHEGQKRSFTGGPYFVHPDQTADILSEIVPNDNELIASGYLHDTVEDCDDVELNDIEDQFGFRIAFLVDEVTNDEKEVEQKGKADYMVEKVQKIHDDALTLKLADRLSNVSNLEATSESFQNRYSSETERMISALDYRKLQTPHKKLQTKIVNCIADF
jgi:(p)ppGpp synthase/HD superfamily hydrolase